MIDKIWKVGVYCRLSEEDRNKKNKNDDSDSIQNQKSMLIKYAINNNWDVVDIYSDDDYSGVGVYRPDFDRLIKDCESGKINLVLCKTQSRFSRDLEVVEKYLHNKFIEWQVRFVSIVDNADTSNITNKKSRQINGLMNEWYLDDLSNNIRKSLKNKREDGLYMGSFTSYGYKKDPNNKHKIIVDEEPALIVKEIFSLYKSGYGYYKIAKILNERGIMTPSDYKKSQGSNFVCCNLNYNTKHKWGTDSISRIVQNDVYIGRLVQGKKTSISYKNHKAIKVPETDWCIKENDHEAIIDMNTWNSIKMRFNKRERASFTGYVNPLSQKVYCKCCNKIFMRNVYHTKAGKKVYLQCKGRKKLLICSNSKSIRLDYLENLVISEINKLLKKYYSKDILNEKYKKHLLNQEMTDKKHLLEVEKEKINNSLISKADYLKNIYEDKVNKLLTDDEFIILKNSYFSDIELKQKQIKDITLEINSIEEKLLSKDNTMDILKKYKKIKNLDKVLVDEFIDKIYIDKYDEKTDERNIEICWNLDFFEEKN